MINKVVKADVLKKFNNWINLHLLQLTMFNIFLLFMFLLRSAGYFEPYYVISVNNIVIVGLILSVLLLGATSKVLFSFSLFFWFFASIIQTLGVDVWAERVGIYTYQGLVLGIVMLIIESIKEKRIK